MLQDLRFALRMMRKQPGLTMIAVLTLALGVGATAAIFSLIQGVLLTPPPYRQAGQLVLIPAARTDGKEMTRPRGFPAAQWMEWQKDVKSFDGIAAYLWMFNFLILPEGSQSMEGMAVTRDYFRVAGLQPILGRTFTEADHGASSPLTVIIIGYDLWQRTFNADPQIIGKSIRVSRLDTPLTVIGVMPPGVRFLPSPGVAQEPNYNVNAQVDFWVPGTPNPQRLKQSIWDIVGRVKEGTSHKQAQEELTLLAARQVQADRDFEGFTPRLIPLETEMNRDGLRILLPLLGAAALVLVIACGNAAALLLVRGLQRQQEYALRIALGVGRAALFRQVSTESLLLAVLGGAVGAGLAFGLVRVFKLIGGHGIPRLDAVTTGWPVLAWGLASAAIAAVLAGILPALRASRFDPIQVLKNAGPNTSAGRGDRRLLRAVTMAQTALTLALLVGAGLLIRTMVNISNVQSGYKVGRILTMSVTSVEGDWQDFHRRALERVSAIPGVEYAAFAWGVPLTGNNWPATIEIEGLPPAVKPSDRISLPLRSVTPDYFKLMGLPIVDGRDIRSTDAGKAPQVAVINQAFVDRYFAPSSAIGKKLWLNGRDRPATEVIGVVTNGRTDDLTQAAEPEIYLSLWQAGAFSKHLVIRTAADPRSFAGAVQRELRSVNPTVAVQNLKTLEQLRSDSLASRTFAMNLLVGFSLVGSALTLVGIYSVLSLSVASRRRELAIRSAVGAGQGDIRKLVFGEGFRLIVAGVVVGALAAVALSHAFSSFLFGVQPADPLTLIGVGVLFVGVALLACWVPARRAVRVDPLEALRYE